ncbi:MAG: 50S ribosomal protein L20 [Oscillospiraceae bacterium]|jgi:ribosomal protein L20|nr:MAG: 50S ribosomal protein L20 [Oscillospiraceae bacterium]
MRVKRAVNGNKNRKKVLKLAKGYYGAKSKQFRVANEAVMKSQAYAFVGRKLKKRDFRSLWITRINAAARINGISYSKLIHGLKNAGVQVNRKMLSELAVYNAEAFTSLVETAKAHQ